MKIRKLVKNFLTLAITLQLATGISSVASAEEYYDGQDYLNVNINQVGYHPDDTKTVIVKSENGKTFQVVDTADGAVVFEGILEKSFKDAPTDSYVQHGDFSGVKAEGKYVIRTDEGESYPVIISNDPYAAISASAFQMLYKQRCGTITEAKYAGRDYAHGLCHAGISKIVGSDKTMDASGGWHDAGDYGRYINPGAKTIQDLFLTVEDFGVTADNLNIPESGNNVADYLDEARYELDWMFKMQEPDGSVHHKVTCPTFPGGIAPEQETAQTVVVRTTTTATADFAAVMAKASVMFKDVDSEYSKKCFEAAQRAWNNVKDKHEAEGFKNPPGVQTGEYGDWGTDLDSIYWASVELYLAGDENAEKYVHSKFTSAVLDGLGWNRTGSYAFYDLARANDPKIAKETEKAKAKLIAHADRIMNKSSKDGYFMALGTTGYIWGSNMEVANNGMILAMAQRITGKNEYGLMAKRHLDYLLGANSLSYCFVTGFGTKAPVDIHHRPSENAGKAMPGLLVGGPNSALQDPTAQAELDGAPPAMCYTDSQPSYSTNEICIYWNSPLLYLLAAFR